MNPEDTSWNDITEGYLIEGYTAEEVQAFIAAARDAVGTVPPYVGRVLSDEQEAA